MSHAVTHSLIALLMWLPFALLGYPVLGAIVGGGFYTLRELYQYFVLGKTHKGRFDYEGMIYPVLTVTIATILC
jgi:uncharacterized membrane protein YkvI